MRAGQETAAELSASAWNVGEEKLRVAGIMLIVVVATIGIVLAAIYGDLGDTGDDLWPFVWLFWAPIGALILVKRPGNGVGQTLLLIGATMGFSFAFLAGAESSLPLEFRVWIELANELLGAVPFLGIIWLLLVYPSGKLGGRLERALGTVLVLFGLLGLAAFAVDPEPMESTLQPSPLAVPAVADVAGPITGDEGSFVVIGLTLGATVSLIRRWRVSSGVERHQFRWLLFGAVLFVFVFAVGMFIPEDSPFLYTWLLAGAAMPGAIGIAVLRYRLYEIDRLISRTLSYALVVGLLGLVFAAGVVWIPSALDLGDSPLLVAASTLVVAALFNPLRKRVQSWVDRRFNRSRYNAERVMDEFAGSLRDRVDPDGLVEGWVGVVRDTMQPSSVAVWVRE